MRTICKQCHLCLQQWIWITIVQPVFWRLTLKDKINTKGVLSRTQLLSWCHGEKKSGFFKNNGTEQIFTQRFICKICLTTINLNSSYHFFCSVCWHRFRKHFHCPLQLWLKINETTGSRGLSFQPNPLRRTRHDNLQWRHDWSREEPTHFPPLSALWNSESNQCNSFTVILLFCLKLIQNRRLVQW